MARYQLIENGWPFKQWLVPVGTILDSADWTWNGIPLPQTIPISVLCLDQPAANEWARCYSGQLYRFHGVPGVTLPTT